MFYKIQDLLDYKKYCSLCNHPLLVILKVRGGISIPNVNVKLNTTKFSFSLTFTSALISINEKCVLDINSNDLVIVNYQNDFTSLQEIKRIFEYSSMVIELHCINKKCKHNYYINTTLLKSTLKENMIININPIVIDTECYNISRFWIQNDYLNETTDIYDASKPENKPISVSLLEINYNNKIKIFNKIKTVINFS